MIAIAFSGGYGVDGNVFFDAIITTAIITALMLGGLAEWVQKRRFGNLMFTALLLAPMASVAPLLQDRITSDYQNALAIPAREDDFIRATRFVASRPGPVLCHNLLLCFEAGKPEEVYTHRITSQMMLAKLPEAECGP